MLHVSRRQRAVLLYKSNAHLLPNQIQEFTRTVVVKILIVRSLIILELNVCYDICMQFRDVRTSSFFFPPSSRLILLFALQLENKKLLNPLLN